MSLDLYEREATDRITRMQPVQVPETGAFDGFLRGTGMAAMKGFAKTARAIDMAGAVIPITQDAITGGTEAQDRYFKEHDEIFGRAVDYWTPNPGEVGAAAEVVGGLVSVLPQVVMSPALAVAATQMGTAEDLALKGVSSGKAQAVGAAQGAGLGLGIWMPILGQNLWQRVVLGGAGFNVLQGAAMRGAGEVILEGTPAEGEFKAFDGAALTLDVLLGMAFGGLAHLSPRQRAQGKAVWERIQNWAGDLQPSQIDAIAGLRQSQHLNVDSTPGRPVAPEDVEAHVNRLRTAIDQLASDKPVSVDDLPPARVEPDGKRWTDAERRGNALLKIAERVRADEGLPPVTETDVPPVKQDAGPPPSDSAEPARTAAPAEGAKAPDPIAMEAERIATERPDVEISIGQDAEGQPVRKTVKQYLDDARAETAKATEEAKLLSIAAECMLGVA